MVDNRNKLILSIVKVKENIKLCLEKMQWLTENILKHRCETF